VSFTKDEASLDIVDVENGGMITITSPFGSAALKGCHEVQNIGAVETYQRRYLWVAAMEIVEHDALDATTQKDAPKHKPTTDPVNNLVSEERKKKIADIAAGVEEIYETNIVGAYAECAKLEDEEKTVLWGYLSSKARTAIKKHDQEMRGNT